jgi:hypothetical protein
VLQRNSEMLPRAGQEEGFVVYPPSKQKTMWIFHLEDCPFNECVILS